MSQHTTSVGLSSEDRPDGYITFIQNYERILKLTNEHKDFVIQNAFDWLETLKDSDTSKLKSLIYGDDPQE
jgi:hypothetical protein